MTGVVEDSAVVPDGHPEPQVLPVVGVITRQCGESAGEYGSGQVLGGRCALESSTVAVTQLAAAYARDRIAAGWMVGWVAAETATSTVTGLLDLADALNLTTAGQPAETTLARLRRHLQTTTEPGLLVFDNVSDPRAVAPYVPGAGSVQVVLTSTATKTHGLGTPVPVDVFPLPPPRLISMRSPAATIRTGPPRWPRRWAAYRWA